MIFIGKRPDFARIPVEQRAFDFGQRREVNMNAAGGRPIGGLNRVYAVRFERDHLARTDSPSAFMQQLFAGGQKTILALIIICLGVSIAGVHREKVFYRNWYGFLLFLAAISAYPV